MVRPLALAGQRFGKLIAVSRAPNGKHGQAYWNAQCDCGNTTVVGASKLISGHTRSCGCLVGEGVRARCTTHGQGSRKHRSRAYMAWKEMNRRIKRDPHYVGKVEVCPEWSASYEAFFRDMGPCPDGYELDRIENSKGYLPGNCRWVDETRQSRNRSYCKLDEAKAAEIRASSAPTEELMKMYGVSKSAIQRVRDGRAWRDRNKVTSPVGKTIHVEN